MNATARLLVAIGAIPVIFGGGAPAHAQVQPKSPVLDNTGEDISIREVSPGGRVLFFGLAHSRPAHTLRTLRHLELLVDEARSAVVRIAAPRLVASPSVYAAVDIETGGLTLARIGESEGRTLTAPRRVDQRSSSTIVLPSLAQVEAMLVRPGKGAWAVRTADGGILEPRAAETEEETDGDIEIALDTFVPLGRSEAAPTEVVAGDVLIVVDPQDLSIAAFELGAEGWVAR